MKSPDLPLHCSNSFQRSFCCPKYSREISPQSHFSPQHRERLVLMALNRSPYDARVTPPKQTRGARGDGAGRCVRQTTCLADAVFTLYLGWAGSPCSTPHSSGVGATQGNRGRKLAHKTRPWDRTPLCIRRRETPIPQAPESHKPQAALLVSTQERSLRRRACPEAPSSRNGAGLLRQPGRWGALRFSRCHDSRGTGLKELGALAASGRERALAAGTELPRERASSGLRGDSPATKMAAAAAASRGRAFAQDGRPPAPPRLCRPRLCRPRQPPGGAHGGVVALCPPPVRLNGAAAAGSASRWRRCGGGSGWRGRGDGTPQPGRRGAGGERGPMAEAGNGK